MKKLASKLKPLIVLLLVIVIGGLGVYYVWAGFYTVPDSYDDSTKIAEHWRSTTTVGSLKISDKVCDNDEWLCAASAICANDSDDGDYIIVYRGALVTRTQNFTCTDPYCVSGKYSSDNTLDFSTYLTRDYCKSLGGRQATYDELVCIHDNIDNLGGSGHYPSAYYWHATMSGAPVNCYNVNTGGGAGCSASNSQYFVCVMGW